jgi:GNAT superfamily N-acetyltransferase
MTTRLPRRWRGAWDFLRWRGPFRFLLLAVREVFSPVFYWHVWHIFETDLDAPLSTASGGPYTIRIYSGRAEIDPVKQIIVSLDGILPTEVDLRADRGDAVGVAFVCDDEAVGYSWMTLATGLELAFGTSWRIQSNEALLYGSYVVPDWRGRGIHRCLDVAMNMYARQRGLIRTLGSISVLNIGALSLAAHSHKEKVMTVILVRVRGLRWIYRKSIGAPFESRFETHATAARTAVSGRIFHAN